MKIRKYNKSDSEYIIEILKLNKQYEYPEVEGPEAMNRVAQCEAAIFLVAEIDNRVAGCIRAIYDGSRALIHLLSVHPDYQDKGAGSALLETVEEELKKRGAPTIAVTISEKSAGYWVKKGFKQLPISVMLKDI